MACTDISFLVFERDPFVLEDIRETLAEAFPEPRISVLDEIKDVSSAIMAEVGRTICIFSTDDGADLIETHHPTLAEKLVGVVLIGPVAPTDRLKYGGPYVHVPRPFNTDMLIAGIRSALSPRRSSP